MRSSILVFFGAVWLALAARADEPMATPPADDPFAGTPGPLAEAVRGFAKDANRWAFTEDYIEFDKKGAAKSRRRARFDPSQHYDVQWTMLEKDGRAATEAEQAKFRKARAKEAQRGRKTLGELLDLARATELAGAADATVIVYEVPLHKLEDSKFPPEKFQAFVRVTRADHQLKSVEVRLREKLRVALVVGLKAAEGRLDFERVLPEAGPAVTKVVATGSASVFFVPLNAHVEITRSEQKRVTPYDDRFVVKPGPLRTIDF